MTDYNDALAALGAAPLSRKAAMLVALLLDREVERRFRLSGEGDVLVFRAGFVRRRPALALVLELAAMRADGPRLAIEPVRVAIADYPRLTEPDYMVSLYNGGTVPRLLVVSPDGGRREAGPLLRAAAAELG